ncbi:MAG: T9SS type A sorting domain-containing protein [Saprospiraceae bacterium]|nr:T9SS type A sorting domain-containing protein [Saprospiraceae bacterium]
MRKITFLLAFLIISIFSSAQAPIGIMLEPITISGLGGIQSFAFGQDNGKILLIGGRTDGLHLRQPFASFDIPGHNTELIVIDPISLQKWTAPLSSLSTNLQEQLSSTNMQFFQQGDYLYLIGGYGYSNTVSNHITYSKLTAVDVPATINAVINSTSFTSFFRQIDDAQFAVTGGHLEKIYDTYYLSGGQKFTGRYNPNNGGSFTQSYTNSIRKFKINDDGTNLSVTHLVDITDAVNLHRRDYNVCPQIMPNGQEGLTAFSGVFQTTADIPFLNCVNIDSSGHTVNNSFSQYYNHYHCAKFPLYSESANEMHTLFFGGIAQYYDSSGVLVQDNAVPFVKTIARVTRTSNGTMTEYKLAVEMPGFLGSSSEFIMLENLPKFPNGVLKYDSIQADTTLIGYIFGGINSTAKNIFFINDGSQSSASSTLYKVFLVNDSTANIDEANIQSNSDLRMQMYPNPNDGIVNIDFDIAYKSDVKLRVIDNLGRIITERDYSSNNLIIGKNHIEIEVKQAQSKTILFISLETNSDRITQKLILHK